MAMAASKPSGRRRGAARVAEPAAPTRDDIYQTPVGGYFSSHRWALMATLRQFLHSPASSFMTALVIGVALALPAGAWVLLDNASQLTGAWGTATELTVFLKMDIKDSTREQLQSRILTLDGVSRIEYISREQALEEFKAGSGLGLAMDALEQNPLPAVLVVSPVTGAGEAEVEALATQVRELTGVDAVQLDMDWVRRLNGLLAIGQRGMGILALFLGVAILIIVGNTIRLIIQNRRHEIVVTKLIGATDGFIRRPFLYWGLWFGLAGGLVAWTLVTVAVWALQGPVQDLAALYHTEFELSQLGIAPGLALFGIGILLGLGGAWLSVARHLRDIEPR